jgi:hypothetical protein
MPWLPILMVMCAAYGAWEIWWGFRAGRMAPLAAGGSYLCAERGDNPIGFWIATAFNTIIVAGAIFVAFLP